MSMTSIPTGLLFSFLPEQNRYDPEILWSFFSASFGFLFLCINIQSEKIRNDDLAISHLSTEQKQYFLERVVTEDNIKSFCNAICSEDTTLVDLLIEYKCLVELPHVLERLLAESYARLKIQNVPLTKDMQVFVESKLIDLRFFTNKDEENKKCTTVSLDDVKTRIKLTCLHAKRMILKYSRGTGNDVDGEFILLGRFVDQNIRVLKRQLKGTYTRLPWEEMEFLLACFTSTVCELREADIIYKLVLDQERLLKHLNHFVAKLREVEQDLKEKDVNIKLSLGNRSLIIRNILNVSPDFVDLYSDHDLVKSVYSLKRISSYIRQALDLYPNEGMEDVETLVLERTLQVIGESLKNTPDSPNVSEEIHRLLARQAPRQARELSTALRDSLSHSRSYTRRPEQDALFHRRLREDLRKMEAEITYILYRKKKDAVKTFLNKVMDCLETEDLEILTRGIDELQEKDINFNDFTQEFIQPAKILFEMLKERIVDKTGVKDLFDEAEEILRSEENRVKDVQNHFAKPADTVAILIKCISSDRDIRDIKRITKRCLIDMIPENPPENFKRFINKITTICVQATERHDWGALEADCALQAEHAVLEIVCQKTFTMIEFMAGRLGGVDELRDRIEAGPEDEEVAKQKVEQIFEDVVNTLDKERDRSTLKEKFEKSKELHRAKGELIKHFDSRSRGESMVFDGFASYVEKLCLKHKNMKDLEKFYEEGDYGKCKTGVQIIEDHYGKFARTVEELSLFSREKYAEAFRAFFETLKLKGKANQNLIDIVNLRIEKRNEEISSYFSSRLSILDGLLGRAGAEPRGPHYAAVEMLALELTEILDDISMFGDGTQFMDDFCPVLIGKNLRNYLAHGDPLADGLPSCPRMAVMRAAALLLRAGGELVRRDGALIGGNIVADFGRLRRKYDVCLGDVARQDAMFIAIQEENEDLVKDCISNGVDPRGTDFEAWTGLHYAAIVGNTQTLQFFLDHNVDLEAKDIYGKTPVQIAYDYTRINVIQYLIERNYLDAGDVITDGNTLLHLAAKIGRVEIVVESLNGENVNFKNMMGQTPLHLACEGGHTAVVQLLLEAGADLQVPTVRRETPLHIATRGGHDDIVRLLLKRGVAAYAEDDETIGKDDREARTLLHIAAQNGYRKIVKTLLSHVDDNILMDFIRAPARNGSLALHLAARRGHAGVVEELLARGCAVDEVDEDGQTSLHVAAVNGFTTVIKLLLNNGAAIDAVENHLRTSLHLAVQNLHAEAVRELLDRGSDVRAETLEGYTALHMAAANGRTEILQILLDRGAQIEAVSHDECTALHLAVKYSQPKAVKCLIDNAKKLNQCWDYVNCTNSNDSTALHVAAAMGDEECAKELLKAGAMIEARDVTSCTALHVAAKYGEVATMRVLIENGCDINAVTPDHNWSALFFAVHHDHLEAVTLLIEKGIKLDTLTENNETALHGAVVCGNKDMVQAILGEVEEDVLKAFVNTPQGDSQQTALHFSVKNGHNEITSLLLDVGADIEAIDKIGNTAMIYAALTGHMDIFLTLLDEKANVNVVGVDGTCPLLSAAANGHLRVVEKLLAVVADPHQTDAAAHTALHWAARRGHKRIAEVLLKSGLDIHAKEKDGFTPLHLAAYYGFVDVAEELLKHKADVNKRSTESLTPLHCASRNGNLKVIRLLLENGADIASVSETNSTALHFAATNDYVAKALLEAGAEVDALDGRQSAALHRAVRWGRSGVVSLLLDFGADLDLRDAEGRTPLILAALNDRGSVLKELLSRGVDANAVDSNSKTALHAAASTGNREMAQLLLDNGADANCTTDGRVTPLHLTASGGFRDLVGTLVTRGARVDAVDADGRTALHRAAASGHSMVVEELVKFGALDRETEDGQTALKLAANGGHADVFDFLSSCWTLPTRGEI